MSPGEAVGRDRGWGRKHAMAITVSIPMHLRSTIATSALQVRKLKESQGVAEAPLEMAWIQVPQVQKAPG